MKNQTPVRSSVVKAVVAVSRCVWFASLAGALFTGCSLIPSDHRTQEAVKTAGELGATHSMEVRKAVETPPVTIIAKGFGKVDAKIEAPKGGTVATETDTQKSSGNDSAFGSSSTIIPFAVKAAIGLVVVVGLVVLIKYLTKQSPAVAAIAGVADREVAGIVGKLEAHLAAASDPNTKATQATILSDANKARGKVAAQAPPPP
jgi:hypothetical protein